MIFTGMRVEINIHPQNACEKKGKKEKGIENSAPGFYQYQENKEQREKQGGLNRRVGYREEAAAGDSRHQGYQQRNNRPGHANHRFSFHQGPKKAVV